MSAFRNFTLFMLFLAANSAPNFKDSSVGSKATISLLVPEAKAKES